MNHKDLLDDPKKKKKKKVPTHAPNPVLRGIASRPTAHDRPG